MTANVRKKKILTSYLNDLFPLQDIVAALKDIESGQVNEQTSKQVACEERQGNMVGRQVNEFIFLNKQLVQSSTHLHNP